MKLSVELTERGFINQHTSESLADIVDNKKRVIYHGIDPSADSAHVGNFVNWMLLYHLATAGHKIIFLVGGGTGMIGDPKPDVERNLEDPELVKQNVAKIKKQAQKIIGGGENIEFVNNADWLLVQPLITFLRDIGKCFTVNELIKLDAIATRLKSETGLSYTEFAYPLLQAYDYLTLNRSHGCDVQVGGSDQWGNIISGVALIRRQEKKVVHAITTPLVIDKVTGKKFGKSEGNAIWLSAEKTTPYQFYQFWLNLSDESVIDYLKLFTPLSLKEITLIEADSKQNSGNRLAQKRLALAVTGMVHGTKTAVLVTRATKLLFSKAALRADWSDEERLVLLENVPTTNVAAGQSLVDALVFADLAPSKREARTLLQTKSIQLAESKITDTEAVLSPDHFNHNLVVLQRGKKQRVILTLK